MKPALRICILECDTPLDGTRQRYSGGYAEVFKALLRAGADELQKEDKAASKERLEFSQFHVQQEEGFPSFDDIDAILITGSRFNAFDDDPWILKLVDFVKTALDRDEIRLVGVCFGHQIIARAMGAPVIRSDIGWEIAVLPVDLTEKGKELFKLESMNIQQMHRDIVKAYPKGVEGLGTSPKCEVQGFHVKDKLITVQGHPEFTGPIVKEIVETRHQQGIFDVETTKDALTRVANRHDGIAVAAGFLRFLHF